jgi:hypothetical protein
VEAGGHGAANHGRREVRSRIRIPSRLDLRRRAARLLGRHHRIDRLGVVRRERKNPLPALPTPTDGGSVRIARANGRVAYIARGKGSGQPVWLMDSTGQTSRFTFTSGGATAPIWSPDGREILFNSIVDGVTAVFRQQTSGLERERLIAKLPGSDRLALGNFRLVDWSRDRRHALVIVVEPATGRDIALLSVDTGQVSQLIHTTATEVQARFSPDGRWIAYASDETGRWEVFVEPFPISGTRSQVSKNGGSQPVWRENGAELYFLAPDGKLMSAAVKTGATFSHDTPRPLFQTRMRPTYPPYPVDYDVTSDAQRFLINGALRHRPGHQHCRELERAVEAEAVKVLLATARHLHALRSRIVRDLSSRAESESVRDLEHRLPVETLIEEKDPSMDAAPTKNRHPAELRPVRGLHASRWLRDRTCKMIVVQESGVPNGNHPTVARVVDAARGKPCASAALHIA